MDLHGGQYWCPAVPYPRPTSQDACWQMHAYVLKAALASNQQLQRPKSNTRASALHDLTSHDLQVVAVGPGGQRFNVSRYYARWQQPRPESYM